MYRNFWEYPWNIPYPRKKGKKVCTVFFLGYPRNIPYPKKTDKNYVPAIFWDIPGICHIPKIDKVGMYRLYFGIYQYPIFILTYVPWVRKI